MRISTVLLAWAYHIHLWVVWRTGRIELIGFDRFAETMRRHERVAMALWHENLVMGIYAIRELRPATLANKSDIGDVISAVLEGQGYHVFRGGSSRSKSRQSKVLDKMVGYFKSHRDVLLAITVDGSAGPARKVKPGVIALAEQAQAPIYILHAECRPCFRIWTWDRTCFPIAFSRVVVLLEGPLPVPAPGIRGLRETRDLTDRLLHDTADRARAYLKTGVLPDPDPALGLDPSYGERDTRVGPKIFGKGPRTITPRPNTPDSGVAQD